MTPKECGQYINNLIANAEIDAAIDNLVKFFQGKSEFGAMRSQVLYIKSRYNKTKNDENKGLISFDNAQLNYNQITNQLLDIAAQLESGNYENGLSGIKGTNNRRWILLMSLLAFVVIAWLSYLFLLEPMLKNNNTAEIAFECPSFEEENFGILVLPYEPIGDDEVSQTHDFVRTRFKNLSDSIQLNADVQSIPNDFALNNPLYPESFTEAENLVSTCQPKPELVVWGSSERNLNTQDLTILTRYKFIGLGEKFKLDKIKDPAGTIIDKTPVITSIATGNAVTGTIELILLGVIAHEQGELDKAIALLTKAETKDPEAALLKGTFLADSYLQKNEVEEAIHAYDSVLNVHPNYGLALNNRAMLYYKNGDYMDAIADFSQHLDAAPMDTGAWIGRGTAYYQAEMYDKALADIKTALSVDTTSTKALQQFEMIETSIEEQQSILKSAGKKLQNNPRDVNALKQVAKAQYTLGDYDRSLEAATKVRRYAPKDQQSIEIISKAYFAKGDTIQLRRFHNEILKADGIRMDTEKMLPGRINRTIRSN